MVNIHFKNALEIKRQLFHLVLGLIIAALYYFNLITPRDVALVLFTSIILFFLYKNKKIKFLDFFIQHFERLDNDKKGIGAINYLIGVLASMILFEKNIALASIIILAIGDSISPLVGLHFGKTKIRIISETKLMEGVLAGIILSSLAASLFVPLGHAIIAATIAMIVEAVELKKKIDDNILIPLISGYILLALSYLI